jgi:hypothetical protein
MTEIITPTIAAIVAQSGCDEDTKLALCNQFTPFLVQAEDWRAKIASVTDPEVARKSRITLKNVRCDAEKAHKALKADVLQRTKALDGILRLVCDTIVPLEEQLREIETKAAREAAAKVTALIEARKAQLAPFVLNPHLYSLANISEDDFQRILEDAKFTADARKAAADKAEAERRAAEKAAEEKRIAEAKAREEEQKRIAAENERLKKEAFESAKREEEERNKRAQVEAKALEEKRAREKAEHELAESRRIESEKRASEEDSRRRAANAPDRDKVLALAAKVRAIAIPTAETPDGKAVIALVTEQFGKMAVWLEKKAGDL